MDVALKQKAPELYNAALRISPTGARDAARQVVLRALDVADVHTPLVDKALNPEQAAASQLVEQLEQLASVIEEPYLEAIGNDEQPSSDSELMHKFRQARAVMTLSILLRDSPACLTDVIYEALFAGVARGELQALLTKFVEEKH